MLVQIVVRSERSRVTNMGLPAKTGQENPATCGSSKFSPSRQGKIGAALAGSLSRKVPESGKAGQKELASQNAVKITKPSLAPVKGWSKLAMPKLPPRSPATSSDGDDSGNYAKQSVKGKHGSAPAEAKSVSGRKQ